MRPRIIIKGDEELGSEYMEIALLELQKLKHLMAFQGLKQDQRKTVFDDGTVIRCRSVFGDETITIETKPQEVEEEEEKQYEGGALLIILRKLVGDAYDYWHWNLDRGRGYHENPDTVIPTEPGITTTWWSCSGFDEVQYYTSVTPAFAAIGNGGCGDSCGLINFDAGVCCDDQENESNSSDTSYLCPCGGTGSGPGAYGVVCAYDVQCSGGCASSEKTLYFPGAKSTRSCTGNQSVNCDQGYSWGVSIDDLSEEIEIGPRTNMSGSESSDISTLSGSQCSPIESVKHVCTVVNEETCVCALPYNPPYAGYDCYGTPYCTDWIVDEEGVPPYRWRFQDYGMGSDYQGCINYIRTVQSGTYGTFSAAVNTVVNSGVKETEFTGLWSERTFSGNGRQGDYEHGWSSNCMSCSDSGSLGGSQTRGTYAFTEFSYGIAGWSTVVAPDGRIAVLIPRLSLTASATNIDGDVSGSIASTTTALLRIVDDSDNDYELAEGESNYNLTSAPNGRADLKIRPECYNPRDIPIEITLQGFHWLVEEQVVGGTTEARTDNILTTFVFDESFYAHLTTRTLDESWQNQELSAFEQWVADNDLDGYAMFLYRRRDYEEEIYY